MRVLIPGSAGPRVTVFGTRFHNLGRYPWRKQIHFCGRGENVGHAPFPSFCTWPRYILAAGQGCLFLRPRCGVWRVKDSNVRMKSAVLLYERHENTEREVIMRP